jgi:hypothetical protein
MQHLSFVFIVAGLIFTLTIIDTLSKYGLKRRVKQLANKDSFSSKSQAKIIALPRNNNKAAIKATVREVEVKADRDKINF